ncbi:MAG: nucleoside diphosphate kinase regulator [Thiohalomonadaceae bacterium]
MSGFPPIVVSTLDMERIDALLDQYPDPGPAEVEALRAELDRADVREPRQMPDNVVTMHSAVHFRMLDNGKEFERSLVYPREIDGSEGKLSIFTPVGSALLGLAVGAHIDWPAPGGKMTRVEIVEILYQPERAGDFTR